MIRCTSRFMLTARSWVCEQPISRKSGLRPSMKAGKRRATNSLLPCWGGMKTISRRQSPRATRSSFSASAHVVPIRAVGRHGEHREGQQALQGELRWAQLDLGLDFRSHGFLFVVQSLSPTEMNSAGTTNDASLRGEVASVSNRNYAWAAAIFRSDPYISIQCVAP